MYIIVNIMNFAVVIDIYTAICKRYQADYYTVSHLVSSVKCQFVFIYFMLTRTKWTALNDNKYEKRHKHKYKHR